MPKRFASRLQSSRFARGAARQSQVVLGLPEDTPTGGRMLPNPNWELARRFRPTEPMIRRQTGANIARWIDFCIIGCQKTNRKRL